MGKEMETSTLIYSLCNGKPQSHLYYEQISLFAKEIKQDLLVGMKEEISRFQKFIQQSQLEKVRTQIEYGLELLMLGVFWMTYGKGATHLKKQQGKILCEVARARRKAKYTRPIWSKLKGELANRYLFSSTKEKETCTLEQLIMWLEATGEYDEEVMRLKQWQLYLKAEGAVKEGDLKDRVLELANCFNKKADKKFSPYIKGVESFRQQQAKVYEKREDRVFCMQPKDMYYLNMVGAQLLNEAYRQDYLKAQKHMIFLPGCMVYRGQKHCPAIFKQGGYECRGCTPQCQVNQISKLGQKYHAKTLILYHESELNQQKIDEKEEGKIGVIGVACVLSLLSGGFKAKRLGYAPQCVLLDYCGCKQHWYKEGRVTHLNGQRLRKILEP